MKAGILAIALGFVSTAAVAVEHPYILWTRAEAAAIRQRVETEPWAKTAYEKMLTEKDLGQPLRNLFRYVVMGDQKAGEGEKKYLLGIVGTHPKTFEALEHGGRHYDCYLDALRYDAVYDLLTAEERQKVEATFRAYIAYQLADKNFYSRTSWLPNMQWPRPLAAHNMAVALGDEKLIRALVTGNGGWKWYLDEYIADGQFYMEEFGKHYSMVGEMLLFCRGLERLGLNDLGYGYTGQGGATMRRYIESVVSVGWPRTQLPGGLPRYAKITMGDAKGSWRAPQFAQHAFVDGFLVADGTGGNSLWGAANMNGRDHRNAKVDKLNVPQWFEIAHAKWPDAHFDYFLAQMRRPGEEAYTPTLFWGLSPIAASQVKPPAAPSYVAPERGFAMLRAEESPAYWESPAPAVALQFATLYVHYVADCFSLLGYHAFNRPIYINRAISAGYQGGPYDFNVRSHCGVVVDGQQAQPIGAVPARSAFSPLAKFVAIHTVPPAQPYTGREVRSSDQPKVAALQVYPGVELTRGLILTREYLFDVFQLRSDKPHAYHWLVHPIGDAFPDEPAKWAVSDELQTTLFNVPEVKIGEAHRFVAGAADWSLTTRQARYGTENRLGDAWFNRQVGVRIQMLGEPGTTAWYYRPPLRYLSGERAHQPGKGPQDFDETGGISIAVARQATNTTFVALHVPFEKNAPRVREFTRLQQTSTAVAARIVGDNFTDRVLLGYGESAGKEQTLTGNGESFTFTDFGFVRVGKDNVEVAGNIRSLRVAVTGTPRLIINGIDHPTKPTNGMLIW